jgi:hypothetical protein
MLNGSISLVSPYEGFYLIITESNPSAIPIYMTVFEQDEHSCFWILRASRSTCYEKGHHLL